MKSVIACVEKDIRLIFSRKTGIAVLVLPVLLLAVLFFAGGDLFASSTLVKPFRFAIRDEESSYISRTLVQELRKIQLFEEITTVKGPSVTDEELFEAGYAAVMTIPEDFFTSMYDMTNVQAKVVLNGGMPAESAIVKTLIRQVVGIVEAEQRAWQAEYGVRYGELTEQQRYNLWYESANHEFVRALGRTSVFDTVQAASDYAEGKAAFLLSAVLSLLCMFLPLSVLKTLPEEKRLGIDVRCRSLGRKPAALLLSKAMAGLIMLLLCGTIPVMLLQPQITAEAVCGVLLAYGASFALFAVFSELSANAARVQTLGNLLIVLSLLFGGAFYPYSVLPDWAQKAAELTIPYRLSCALRGERSGLAALGIMLLVFTAVLLLLPRKRRQAV